MKKKARLLILLALCCSVCFTSCGDDDDPVPSPGNTETGGNQGGNSTVETGNSRTINVTLEEDGTLVGGGLKFKITSYIDNTAEAVMTTNEVDKDSFDGGFLVPAYIVRDGQTYSVTSLGTNLFGGFNRMTELSLPKTLKSIGVSAFSNCRSLTSMDFPNSLLEIKEGAFQSCYRLSSIKFGSSISKIDSNAFYKCENLTSVYITDLSAWLSISFGDYDSNPLIYAKNLFLNGELVSDLVIPNYISSIGHAVFCGYKGLTSVIIPNSVTTIGWSAFASCSSLTSVEIGNSVTEIGRSAFYNCTNLTSVEIPNSVKEIGSYAFNDCTSLTLVKIGNSVTTIGGSAFQECTSLREIISMNTTPPTIDSNTFTGVLTSDCVVKVPAGSVAAYKQAEGWKEFTNIVAL